MSLPDKKTRWRVKRAALLDIYTHIYVYTIVVRGNPIAAIDFWNLLEDVCVTSGWPSPSQLFTTAFKSTGPNSLDKLCGSIGSNRVTLRMLRVLRILQVLQLQILECLEMAMDPQSLSREFGPVDLNAVVNN